ncbi:MAG TPA: hypothetical protein PKL65_05675 [Bacteroidales bacterium]|jgi:energy-coupling factor transporter transmembrane protein EcfT|nr:hypothetical protein [Bacteroidales bacterium]HNR41700.1 hypothetical protein [Bacteroidales bacterium]HPM19093.1 hypothetical protein [Bacteroidales bacterium]HQG78548.1 hypothetical protein [Bacteroidales bacterium]
MAREIISAGDIRRLKQEAAASKTDGKGAQPARDSYSDRLFKYIPAELVAGYIFIQGILKNIPQGREALILQWIVFGLFCLLTPLYLRRIQKVFKIQQLLISLLSFVVWCFALGGPFALSGWYDPVYGQILLPVFTLAAAIWEAEK